jgi:hypothetical protein
VAIAATFWKTTPYRGCQQKLSTVGDISVLLPASLCPDPSLSFSTTHPEFWTFFSPCPRNACRPPPALSPFEQCPLCTLPAPPFLVPAVLPILVSILILCTRHPDPWGFSPHYTALMPLTSLAPDLAIQAARHAHTLDREISRLRFVCGDNFVLGPRTSLPAATLPHTGGARGIFRLLTRPNSHNSNTSRPLRRSVPSHSPGRG